MLKANFYFFNSLRIKVFVSAFFILIVNSQTLFGQNNILENGIGVLSLTGCGTIDHSIKITGTGDVQANKAFFNSETTLEEIDMNFDVRIDSLNPSGDFLFGIGKYSGGAGTMVEFGGTDSTSFVVINRLNVTTPVFILQYPLPFKLSLGHNYKIRVGKRIRQLQIEVTSDDGINHFFNDSLSFPTPFFGCLWGTPFIGCNSGTISVTGFSLTTPLNLSPRLAVWGDSFIEGNALADVGQRYVSLIKDSIGYQNVSIMGRGGENSYSLYSRFPTESRWFRGSKYALVAIGVNDRFFTLMWQSHMIKYLDSLKKHGTIPIIATLSPRADRMPFIAQVNNWIRNNYNGAYIDLSKTISPNGVCWGSGMGTSDSIHPSAAGHLAIYERIKIEAPYLFRDVDPFTVDYFNETTFEGVSRFIEYSTFSNLSCASFGSGIKIPVIPGNNLYFKDTTLITPFHSLYDILSVPDRPDAPSSPSFNRTLRTVDWKNNPDHLNFTDYECSIDSGASWTTCTKKPMYISDSTMSFQLRIKASASNFRSSALLFDTLISLPLYSPVVYPNPVVNNLVVDKITKETLFTLYSADGRVVKMGMLNNYTTVISTSDLSAGFYILMLYNDSLKRSFKIIKK